MKYAIIMTVHNNPSQLKRLCKSLINDNAYFYIHVDKKTNFEVFNKELKDIPNLKLFSEHKVYWADISQVDATISLLEKALEDDMDYIFFISGQDYLIKGDNNLLKYVDVKYNYMEYQELPYSQWGPDGRTNRYRLFHNIVNSGFIKFNPRNKVYKKLNNILLRIQKMLKLNRKFIKNHKPYSGANWFNINKECARYIVDNYKKYYNYFKFVAFPDEMFIQTIVLNSPLKEVTINNYLRYVDWHTGPEEPRTLTIEDYERIINSDAIFARKFDVKKDEKILDMIDRYRSEIL